ncbi:MAG: hypothetical protein ACOC32_04370 [Nanoarchaeota archaeon]
MQAKSLIIGRKKVEDDIYHCMITFFDVNDPHLTTKSPIETKECVADEVDIADALRFKFLPRGNDIVINDLSQVSIEEKDGKVIVNGSQQ